MKRLLGGVEAGGTKFVCAVGTGPEDLRAEARIPTTTPGETIAAVVEFFHKAVASGGGEPLSAIGIASFGPIDLDPASFTWGHVTSTPKAAWRNADLAGPLARAFGVPVGFDTDVNGAALAEHRWGAARGLDTVVYLTVGTGIGGGALVEGRLLHGRLHPEMGHMFVNRRADDRFASVCPYHRSCLEGLASGPAIAGRWGAAPETLAPDHPAWELEAEYLARGVANLVCVLSPERIILGGGVMEQEQLFPAVRRKLAGLLNGYIAVPELTEDHERYIVPPDLGARAGVLGAIALAAAAGSA